MTTYSTADYSKSMTNLVSNPSFEGTGWSGGSYDTAHAKYGKYGYKMTGSTSSWEVLANNGSSIPMTNTHIYYVRWYIYHEGAGGSTGCYFGIAEPNFVEGVSLGPANQWNMISAVNNRSSFSSGSQGFRLDYNNSNNATSVWFDGVMLIDLTAAFGSGNEPTKEWMDENVPFFEGTKNIILNLSLRNGDVLNCPYSGAGAGIGLRKGTYKLEVWGAQGGYRSSATYGGKGGYSVGTVVLNKKTDVFLYSGGAGNTGKTAGGFNGGGRRGKYNGGGGGSDIRLGQDSLYARAIVAGGGGSDGSSSRTGGAGGGTAGQANQGGGYGTNKGPGNTTYSGSSSSTTASSQSTTVTGSTTAIYGGFGFGGNGQGPVNNGYGGAGGGGWYGGSGTQPDSSGDDDKSGAGGSGYVYTSSTASQYPSGCLLDSSMYLTNASTTIGTSSFLSPTGSSETGHSGDGYCRITVIQAGFTATWVADGATVRQDTLDEGDTLSPPNVDKTGFDVSWQVDGVTVDLSTYKMPAKDITLTAVYIAKTIHITYYDSGVLSYATGTYGGAIDLPTGSNGTGRFVGWWDGSGTFASTYTAYGDTLLIARYDLVGAKLTLDSVSLQPNPVEVSATVLVAITAVMTESSVPRWAGVTFTASDGLPMSSPFQVGIWDTSEGDPMAVFAGKGIKSSGRDVPPLQAQTVPLPRCGIWSAGISDANGNISFSITGTVTGGPYTSTIVMLTESTVNVTRATISYNGGTAVAGQCMGSKVEFPKGTYSTFTITITGLSMPYEHAHILNIAPGGSE